MRILLAWEIGRNLGNVTKLVEIGRALSRKRGKNKPEIFFALQNPAIISSYASDLECQVLQAPFSPPREGAPDPQRGPPIIYPDDLRAWGYDNPKILIGQIQAWRSLFDLARPDVLVTQAAPTALLASRGLGFKTMNFGTGYDVPPATTPMPSMRYWEQIDPPVLLGREEHILRNINRALNELVLPVIPNFADILQVDAEVLTVFEELDHYPNRAQTTGRRPRYVGPFYSLDIGEALTWRKKAKKRIFASITPGLAHFQACLQALTMMTEEYDIIVSVPGIPDKVKAQIEKPHLRVVSGPVRLDGVLKGCDLGISHAGTALSSAMAAHGVPQLLLPGTIEQLMFARALGRTNSARGMVGEFGPQQIIALAERLLVEPEFKKAAEVLAKKYKGFDSGKLAGSIATDITKLAG